MKALIISEDENVYTTLNQIFKNAGYDTIIYKWLLKALDNIEEIQPDCIVVSSSEYPRHWKTLVQFVKSGIGGDDVEIYLYEPTPVSQEDAEKAKVLGVTGCFDQFEAFENMIKKVEQETAVPEQENAVPEQETAVPEPVEGPQQPVVPEDTTPISEESENSPETSISNTGHFMFTHPCSHIFISGKFFDYNGKTLSCSFNDITDMKDLSEGEVIERFTFFDSQTVRMCMVKINELVSIVSSNPFIIVEVQEIYEQN